MDLLKSHLFSVEYTPFSIYPKMRVFINYSFKKKEIPVNWYNPLTLLTSIKILKVYPGRTIQLGEDSFNGVSIKRRVIKYRYRKIRYPA